MALYEDPPNNHEEFERRQSIMNSSLIYDKEVVNALYPQIKDLDISVFN
jgi:hypothetical protein